MNGPLHKRCNRLIGGVMHKRCTKCGEWKPRVASFRPKKRNGVESANVHSWCRVCEALNSRDWHAANYVPVVHREAPARPDLNASGAALAECWR